MEYELSKLQLQEMLREMGVKFSHDTPYETLQKLLKIENRKKWLGLDEEGNIAKDKVIIKRRARKKDIPTDQNEKYIEKYNERDQIITQRDIENPLEPGSQRQSFDLKKRIEPEADVKIVSEHIRSPRNFRTHEKSSRNNQKLVLRRADGNCELCGSKDELNTRYILEPSEGGEENSVKNVVALCRECIKIEEFSKPDIKQLKRKARSRITNEIKVVYKKNNIV